MDGDVPPVLPPLSLLQGITICPEQRRRKRRRLKFNLGASKGVRNVGELGHRQSNCLSNGVRKRKSRKKVYTGYDFADEAPLQVVEPFEEIEDLEQTQSSQIIDAYQLNDYPPLTPSRMQKNANTLMQESPRSVTRRMLALAMTDEGGSTSPPEESAKVSKKITPRKRKKLGD